MVKILRTTMVWVSLLGFPIGHAIENGFKDAARELKAGPPPLLFMALEANQASVESAKGALQEILNLAKNPSSRKTLENDIAKLSARVREEEERLRSREKGLRAVEQRLHEVEAESEDMANRGHPGVNNTGPAWNEYSRAKAALEADLAKHKKEMDRVFVKRQALEIFDDAASRNEVPKLVDLLETGAKSLDEIKKGLSVAEQNEANVAYIAKESGKSREEVYRVIREAYSLPASEREAHIAKALGMVKKMSMGRKVLLYGGSAIASGAATYGVIQLLDKVFESNLHESHGGVQLKTFDENSWQQGKTAPERGH